MRALLVGCVLLVSSSAVAQSVDSARGRFARGVDRAQHGDLEAAALDFEEAYRLSPNYVVLYNLGQAYLALGKPAEALDALQSYLQQGGVRVPPTRRAEVQEAIARCQSKVGFVAVEVDAVGAEVWVDGRSIGKTPLRAPITLLNGSHGLTVTLANHSTFVGNVEVEAQKTLARSVHLEPSEASVTPSLGAPALPLGLLAVESPLPAVESSVDGAGAHRVSADPSLVPIGVHRVRCARDGYVAVEVSIEVAAQGVARVSCSLLPDPRLLSTRSAIVSLIVSEPGARIQIDGRRSQATARLPSGTHLVHVQRSGFIDWDQTVNARPGFPQTISVELRPTPEHAKELADRASTRRDWAYVIGGTGLALLGTGVTLYATNSPRYAAWARDRDALSRDTLAGPPSAALNERSADVRGTAVSIQRQDDLALGTTVLGGALLSYAVASWLTAK